MMSEKMNRIMSMVGIIAMIIGMYALGYNWFMAERAASYWEKRALTAEEKPITLPLDLSVFCDGFVACSYLLTSSPDRVTPDTIAAHDSAWKALDKAYRKCSDEKKMEVMRP